MGGNDNHNDVEGTATRPFPYWPGIEHSLPVEIYFFLIIIIEVIFFSIFKNRYYLIIDL